MYELALVIQICSIVFCAVGTFLLYSRIDKALSKNLLASALFAMVFGVGYLMEMMARNEGEALYALITQYIGLACVALFFSIYATELFHFFRMPKLIWRLCFCFNLATFVAVLTSGYHHCYYKSMTFVEEGLFPHLETENTLWFYIFMVLLMAMIVYSAAMFIIATIKSMRKKFNFLASTALIAGIAFMWGSFASGFNGYEPISACVCIVIGVTSFIMMNSKSSAILNTAYAESYMNSTIGQIIVTKDMRFLECNKTATKFFPAFKDYHKYQDVKIEGDGIFYNEEEGKLHVNEKCYAVTTQTLEGSTESREGLIICLTDVTDIETQRTLDGLTGLFNRQAYFDKVAAILDGKPPRIDVLMADLNGLKTINDTLGHAEGDKMIRAAADCIKKTFIEDSYAFRLGGDEFAVISTAGEAHFEEMLIRLANAVDEVNVGREYLVSLSCGTSFATLGDDTDIATLMKNADIDMYQNKRKYYEVNHIDRRHS